MNCLVENTFELLKASQEPLWPKATLVCRTVGPNGEIEDVAVNQPEGDVRVDTGPNYLEQMEAAIKEKMDVVSEFPQTAKLVRDLWPE